MPEPFTDQDLVEMILRLAQLMHGTTSSADEAAIVPQLLPSRLADDPNPTDDQNDVQ
jgi:hypothetical protein